MDYSMNYIIILAGVIIAIISFGIIFLSNKNNIDESYQINSPNMTCSNEEMMRYLHKLFEEENYKTISEIKRFEGELSTLTESIDQIKKFILDGNKASEETNQNFDNVLNYNQFLRKNKAIVDLYKHNKTPEEIAQTLNKSIREVEMIIRLIK